MVNLLQFSLSSFQNTLRNTRPHDLTLAALHSHSWCEEKELVLGMTCAVIMPTASGLTVQASDL
jgi:hypothetical protein